MSEEQLKAFIAKVQADTSLQEQLKAEGADPVAIAKAAGFSISTEDLNPNYRQNLSEKDLENVAGGVDWKQWFCTEILTCGWNLIHPSSSTNGFVNSIG